MFLREFNPNGGGGFFLACERMFDHSFPACASFFLFAVEISSRTLISLFYARISAQWLSKLRRLLTSVLLRFARELVSLISMPGQHRQLTPTSLIGSRVYCVFTINLPPALLAERPGLLRATAITRGGGTDTE